MTDENAKQPKAALTERLNDAMFDVEHALGLYAKGFFTLPAEAIYDEDALAPAMDFIRSCHIYLVGFVPRIQSKEFLLKDGALHLVYTILGNDYTLIYEVPGDWVIKEEAGYSFMEDPTGKKYWPDDNHVQRRLSAETGVVDFDVKYIGQAYGQDGSRNALDRLLKHETLQKISLKGIPEGYKLTLLLLSIEPSTQLITMFNPFAKNKDENGGRIRSGLDKLFNTSEQERVTLYEASLIKYFAPEFNKEFKESFPSTNLKVLRDCYSKDFSAVVAEIIHDDIPFRLKSHAIDSSHMHIAKHDLHKAEDRKMFFGM